MKKNLIFLCGILAIVAAAVTTSFSVNAKAESLSLMMLNIEALTTGEGTTVYLDCKDPGVVTCPADGKNYRIVGWRQE